jgi:hypothetical protein
MADFVNIPLGYNIPTQIPLDVKTYVSNEDELKNLGFANQKVFKYYKGLIIYCIEENTRYEWNEVTVDNDGSGLLDSNYTYPINHSAFGINYSNKTYNFFKVIFNSSILDGSETKLEAGTNIEIQGDGTIASPYIISADVITSETSIADGDNTTVEGSGSTLDPYRINVELPLPQDGSETKLVSGENIIISGNGTQLSPYVISGKNIDGSETKIQAGSNVTISGNGTIASPYIIHSLSSSTPNNITYLVSSDTATITGDGSSVTPYSVNVIPSDGSDTIITEGDNIIIEGIGTQSEPYIISVADHTHLISDITDLQNQLNSKANINHFHNISDIINLQSFLNNKEDKNQKGIANGYTPLDSNNKVPLIHINDSLIGNVNYQGLWNPTTNVPNLTTVGPKGHYYICTADGNRFGIDFKTGDWIISDGTSWSKVDNTDAVSTVFGRTGNVVAQLGDYTTAQVTENTNKNYQTDNQKLFNDATSSIQTQLNSKVNKSGIENSLPILDLAGNNLGAIETNDDHVSLKGSTGVLLDAPSTVVNSLSGYQDYLVGVGLDGQLIPVKRDAGLYAPTATNATVQNLLANTPTKMNALITLTQAMTSPTLQWSVNFSNTSNQATTVRIKLGLNNVATGTGILYTVPRFTSLTITGASPYAPTIASGTEVSAFIESSTVASVNSVTIKLDSGVSALTVDQTVIDGSTNPVSSNAVFDALVLKQNKVSNVTTEPNITKTLAATDEHILFTNANAVTFTIPTNASVPIPVGTKVRYTQQDDGIVSVTGAGITFVTNLSLSMVKGETRVLTKIATDTWTVEGNEKQGETLISFTKSNYWGLVNPNWYIGGDGTSLQITTDSGTQNLVTALSGFCARNNVAIAPFDMKLISIVSARRSASGVIIGVVKGSPAAEHTISSVVSLYEGTSFNSNPSLNVDLDFNTQSVISKGQLVRFSVRQNITSAANSTDTYTFTFKKI